MVFLSESSDGVTIDIHVVPRASRTKIVGEHDGRLKLQVKAPPVDGAANKEIVRFLAKSLGVQKRVIGIVSGQSGRRKRISVTGLDLALAREALQGLL